MTSGELPFIHSSWFSSDKTFSYLLAFSLEREQPVSVITWPLCMGKQPVQVCHYSKNSKNSISRSYGGLYITITDFITKRSNFKDSEVENRYFKQCFWFIKGIRAFWCTEKYPCYLLGHQFVPTLILSCHILMLDAKLPKAITAVMYLEITSWTQIFRQNTVQASPPRKHNRNLRFLQNQYGWDKKWECSFAKWFWYYL